MSDQKLGACDAIVVRHPFLLLFFLFGMFLLLNLYLIPLKYYAYIDFINIYNLKRIMVMVLVYGFCTGVLMQAKLRTTVFQMLGSLSIGLKVAFGIMLTAMLISALLAPLPLYGLLQCGFDYMMILFLLCVAALSYYDRDFKHYFLTILVLALLAYVVKIFSFYIQYSQLMYFYFYANPRFLAHVFTICVPLLVYSAYLFKDSKSWRFLCLVLGACCIFLGIMQQSRGLCYEAIFLILVYSCFYKNTWCYLKRFFAMLFLGICMYAFFHYVLNVQSAPFHYDDVNVNGRMPLWIYAIHLIKQHPFFGVGPLHYPYEANVQYILASSPHNLLLHMASEYGLIVTVSFVVLVVGLIWKWLCLVKKIFNRKRVDLYERLWVLSLCASMLTVAFHSEFSGLGRLAVSIFLIMLVAGFAVGHYWQDLERSNSYGKGEMRWHKWVLIVFMLFIFLSQAIASVHYYKFEKETSDAFFSACPKCIYHPSFWLQGNTKFYHASWW